MIGCASYRGRGRGHCRRTIAHQRDAMVMSVHFGAELRFAAPTPVVPEFRYAVALPLVGIVVAALVLRRRRRFAGA